MKSIFFKFKRELCQVFCLYIFIYIYIFAIHEEIRRRSHFMSLTLQVITAEHGVLGKIIAIKKNS